MDFSQTDKVKCATKSSYASKMQAVSSKFDKKLNVPCSIESLRRKLDDVPVISSLVSQRAQKKSRDLFFNSEMEKRVQKRKFLKSERVNASMDAQRQLGPKQHKNATLLQSNLKQQQKRASYWIQ